MKVGIAPSRESPKVLVAEPEFRQRMAGWSQLLELCGKTPGRKRVHELRVATQRLLAELDFCCELQELDCRAVRSLHRWRKWGKKLRRALSPVRDADVCLEQLARLRRSWGEPGSPEALQWPENQLEALVVSLQRARKRAAKRLTDAIEEQSDRTALLSAKLAQRLAEPMQQMRNEAPARLVPLLQGMVVDFPQLDAGNLHRFRKRVKQVRSLAEVAATVDGSAREKAGLLKEMQGAIGRWRDLQVLAKLAWRKRATRLAGVIDAMAEKALLAALQRFREWGIQEPILQVDTNFREWPPEQC